MTDHAKRGAAKVEVTSPGRGLGDVLIFPYGEPVILDSGGLTFDRGCWENASSRICAW